jgi:hypothetical protein
MKPSLGSAILAASLLFASNDTSAALVTVAADVTWTCTTGNGGFEAGCNPDVETGNIVFNYWSDVIDTDQGLSAGQFESPLASFSMTVEQQSRPDLVFSLSGPSAIRFAANSSGDTLLQLTADVLDQSGSLGYGSFVLNVYRTNFLGDVNELPGASFWNGAIAYVGVGYGVSETDWASNFTVSATEIAEPSTIAAVVFGLIALALTSRRQGATLWPSQLRLIPR